MMPGGRSLHGLGGETRGRWPRVLRLETGVMSAAVLALVVLVVLPLLFLLAGSFRGEDGLSLEHFTEALTAGSTCKPCAGQCTVFEGKPIRDAQGAGE